MTESSQGPREYSRYQQGVIRRYYQNMPDQLPQKLAELVGELFLAEGKKKEKLLKQAAQIMTKMGLPLARVEHLTKQGKPELLAEVVKEWEGKR